jgi:hypothetical protein
MDELAVVRSIMCLVSRSCCRERDGSLVLSVLGSCRRLTLLLATYIILNLHDWPGSHS